MNTTDAGNLDSARRACIGHRRPSPQLISRPPARRDARCHLLDYRGHGVVMGVAGGDVAIVV